MSASSSTARLARAAVKPVGGVAVFSQPAATYKYNRNSVPNMTATTTDIDGIAYVLNVAPNRRVTIAASGFRSHDVTARPDTLTLTMLAATPGQ